MDLETLALNLAYAAYVAASLLPGGIKLRLGLVAQSLVFITWGIVADNRTAIAWNLAFGAVNAWQAIRLARRNSVSLTPEEEQVRLALFGDLSRRDFLMLWSTGHAHSAQSGARLCTEGTPLDDLVLLLEGDVEVRTAQGVQIRRRALTFIGEMSFVSGEPASADVAAAGPIRFRSWNQEDLRNLHALNEACARSVQHALGRDMTHKLRS